jgi:NAD(P)-dependent dehydrogenase (short-subunit alcohol dehydrogenase family)
MSGAAAATTDALGLSDAELASRPTTLAADLLAGRTVVVSGGGSGIGRATAWLAARLGARVIICGRTDPKLARVRTALERCGFDCHTYPLDIRERAAVERLFEHAATRCGGLDLLVNSAGGQFPQAAIDFSDKGWRAVIDTNLTGTFNMMQAAARHWRSSGRPGSIVNVVVSPRGLHQVAHTCAARAGVVALTQAVAVEWAPLAIRVNCVAPGATTSEGWAAYPESIYRRYAQSSPLRRTGSPWEIAESVLFVGGPGGAFITGQTLHVNGGSNLWGETWTAGKPEWFVAASSAWQQP